MTARLSVALVSHDASRTGAPAMALKVGATLTELGHEVRPVVRGRGRRMADFSALGRLRRDRLRLLASIARRLRLGRWLPDRLDEISAVVMLLRVGGDLVWCNSLATACYVRPALLLRRRVVLHSHEIDPVASDLLDRYRVRRHTKDLTVVACSRAAAAVLERELGLPADGVNVVLTTPEPKVASERAARSTFVVGACGVPTHPKGVDLFARLAERFSGEDVRWTWVGGRRPRRLVERSSSIEFVPPVVDAGAEIAGFDAFVLTSRAESASLVILEAMLQGVPVVAFDVGGVRELVGDAGLLVPLLDLDSMEAAISSLRSDVRLREELADAGRSRARFLCDPTRWRAAVSAVLE